MTKQRSLKADSPVAYPDIKFVLDLALRKDGLRYEFSSPGRAIHFKQRCYKYRNLLREMQQEQLFGVPGARASTAYDLLIVSQINAEGQPDKLGSVLIFRHFAPQGKLIDPETGEEIEMKLDIPLFDEGM